VAGSFIVAMLTPFSAIIHVASAIGLILLGIWLLVRGFRRSDRDRDKSVVPSRNCFQTYLMVLGITLLNPVTITYFTTLILGLKTEFSGDLLSMSLFVAGAFLASLSWQTILAGTSGLAHKRMQPSLQKATFALGNIVIIILGIAIFFGVI